MNTSRLPARHATRSILMIACLASVTPAQAIDVVWQGGNGAWSEARWSSGSIADGAAIHALIDGGNVLSSTVHLDRNAAIGRVTLSAADTLVISGGYTLSLLAGGVSGPGTLRIDGGVGRAALVVSDGY